MRDSRKKSLWINFNFRIRFDAPARRRSALVRRSSPVVKRATVQDLQSAFNMESNAHARYSAFAERADHEGAWQ